jgi:L(+)-tartrate dehydratase alpha subunit
VDKKMQVRNINYNMIEEVGEKLTLLAATRLPDDWLRTLNEIHAEEKEELSKGVLQFMLAGAELASKEKRAICADVGLPRFYVKMGNEAVIDGGMVTLERALRRATAKVTAEIPLRSNRCHPLTRKNPGNNVGVFAPSFDYSFEPDADWIEITTVHKGGGFGSDFRMLFAGDGIPGLKRFFLDVIAQSAKRGLACQPGVIGIGIGGTKDQAFSLGKQAATLRIIGDRHPEKEVAALEKEMLRLANSIGIGVMGLPGKTYAADVHIEIAYTHSAFMPVGIHFFCQALRRACARINSDGTIEYRNDPKWFTEYLRRSSLE